MTTLFERADAASNTGTAYAMTAGDEFYGINAKGASDWIAVTLQAGVTYSFGAVGIGAANSGVTDPLLKLHDANGALLAADDDRGPGLTSALKFTASSTGTYFIEVKALTSHGDGVYGLALTVGSMPSYSVEMAAGVLYRDGSSWAGTPATAVNVTWGVRATGPALDAGGHPTAFQQLTAGQAAATQAALTSYADVADITFTQVNPGGTTNNATILVGAYTSTTDGAGAFAQFPGGPGASNPAGDLWINNNSVGAGALAIGTYDYWVFLHELGHALGLSHPGDYNATPGVTITYQKFAQFEQDSNQYTVMSYFRATDTEPKAPGTYSDTLMIYDIYAVQKLYGVNRAARAGDDTYGFHSNLSGAYDFTVNDDPLLCIWDGAGKDTLDLSGFRAKQRIDLNAGAFSDVGGFKGNLSIAIGCRIENAVGGRGDDTIFGNDRGNVLKGGKGLDILVGGTGSDRMTGGAGADGFIFLDGDGRDVVTDFSKADDVLSLGADLWGGTAMTGAEVLTEFADVLGGDLVFDFGTDVLTLLHVSSIDGMADRIVIS
jgi:serralysin